MFHDVALAAHIAAGAAGLVLGPVAMAAAKSRGVHTRVGEAYHWIVLVLASSAVLLAVLNLDAIWWFIPIAFFSYGFAFLGYWSAKTRTTGWITWHVIGQAGSYIALVTALLVVNAGQALIIWFVPTIVGSPLIAWIVYEVIRGRRPKHAASG